MEAAAPLSAYEMFAAILSYPQDDYQYTVGQFTEFHELSAKVSDRLMNFSQSIGQINPQTLEEIFTSTFDMNPDCCLELGWHLFGENYGRGEFLVKMRKLLRSHNLTESTELPDHLSHCMRLLGNLDGEYAATFIKTYFQPAIEKMKSGLPENNIYAPALTALDEFISEKYPMKKEVE